MRASDPRPRRTDERTVRPRVGRTRPLRVR